MTMNTLAAILTSIVAACVLLGGGYTIMSKLDTSLEIAMANQTILQSNVLVVQQIKEDISGIEIDIAALQNDTALVLYVDEEEGYMIQKLSAEFNFMVVKVPFVKTKFATTDVNPSRIALIEDK
jgi:hypothetical protein